MEPIQYEMIYQVERQIPRRPKWAREERCEYCDCCKTPIAAGAPAKPGTTQPRTPEHREPKHAA